jgi:hypothetical protein
LPDRHPACLPTAKPSARKRFGGKATGPKPVLRKAHGAMRLIEDASGLIFGAAEAILIQQSK